MNEFTCDAASRAISISPQVNAPGDNDSEATGDTAVDRTARDRGRQGAVGSATDRDPSHALSTQVEAPAGSGAPRGMWLKRPVSDGSSVRQSFSHGRSKAVVVEKTKRRLLPRSEELHLPAPGGAQCGGGETVEPDLTEPRAKLRAHGIPIAAAPSATSGSTRSAGGRGESKTTREASTIPPSADSRGLLTERAVAVRLSLSPATLRNWRVKGLGPAFVRLSRRAVRYQGEVVDEWIAMRARRTTCDNGRENG
jgi:hypothetical protein